jgi:hypothetical protein
LNRAQENGGRHHCNPDGFQKLPQAASREQIDIAGQMAGNSYNSLFMRPTLCALPGDAITVGIMPV